MSFEGTYERLCANGHVMHADVYMASDDDKCSRCGEGIAWWNLVDETNGEGVSILLEAESVKECPCCMTVLEIKYKIPTGKGHRVSHEETGR